MPTAARVLSVCTVLAAALATSLLPAVPALGAEPSDAVVGTWNLKFHTPDNRDHEPVFVISRAEGKLKGEYRHRDNSEKNPDVKSVEFADGQLTFLVQAGDAKVTFKGKVTGDAVKGTCTYDYLGQTGNFDFEGTKKAVALDPAKLVGEWTHIAGERDGQKVDPERLKGTKCAFAANELTLEGGPAKFVMKYKVDPSKQPAGIELEITEGLGVGAKAKGIIELKGDELKLCYAIAGEAPKAFKSEKNGEHLFVLARKPAPAAQNAPAASDAGKAQAARFDEERPAVAKGEIESVEYASKTTGTNRKIVVYTPPGVPGDVKLPVLYLLHGAGDDETGWQVKGSAAAILDNLIADKKIVPMLVVMPNGFAKLAGSDPAVRGDFKAFEKDLLSDVIPFVESHYPVKTGREDRAIAGLSMGSAQSLLIGLGNLDKFASIGAFSGANFRGPQSEYVKDPEAARTKLKLFWLSCGEDDKGVLEKVQQMHAYLDEQKIPHTYRIGPGAHDWGVWKNDLFLFSQRLFRERSASAVNLAAATPAEALKVAKGFKVELLYSVPKEQQGSWVNMCVDPKGRLIVSDQYGPLYRVTPGAAGSETKVEQLPFKIGGAHGLLYAFDSLYVMVNETVKFGDESPKLGLHRLKSRDGGDTYEAPELLREFVGQGEHGSHAIVPTPDGKSLYVVCGNQAKMTQLAGSRVPRLWGEDHLLPRMPDGNGFMAGVLGPGGCIYQTDPEGKAWDLISTGYRNQFDGAFNRLGDFFTYDADMEWDINTPWYRPTRVCFAASGAEFGWRNGAGKWPAYYPDSLSGVHDIGPGSPTGITFGYGAKFPAKYQEALFICDWSYGKMHAVQLTPNGASYKGESEEFLAGSPLPLTDVVINPKDGAMYVTVGGRKTQSGLYRVTYAGTESTASVLDAAKSIVPELHQLRRKLEAFHGKQDPQAIEVAWPFLNHEDRFIRYAARTAIEHQDPKLWQEKALAETDPGRSIAALLALVRAVGQDPFHHPRKPAATAAGAPATTGGDPATKVGATAAAGGATASDRRESAVPAGSTPPGSFIPGAPLQDPILDALARLNWAELTATQKIDTLRTYAVLFNRLGWPSKAQRAAVINRFDPLFPADSREVNAELCNLLVYLEAPGIAGKTLALIEKSPTQEEQMEYVRALRVLSTGWTLPERNEYFSWFLKAASFKGGNSLRGFLTKMKTDAVATLSAKENEQLKAILEAKPNAPAPIAGKPRALVKKYKLDDLVPLLGEGLKNRDFDRGRRLFGEANCFTCHRFATEGGAQGPDLTGIAGRFNPRDLLESIITPSKEVSDQYQAIIIEQNDGKIVTGRIVNYNNDTMIVMSNMLDPNGLTNVNAKNVAAIEKSNTSMMPEGLLDVLEQDEVLDLMAYLLSRGDRASGMFGAKAPATK